MGNPEGARDHREANAGNAADNLPAMFARAEEKNRSVPFGDVQAGWGAVALLALSVCGWGVL